MLSNNYVAIFFRPYCIFGPLVFGLFWRYRFYFFGLLVSILQSRPTHTMERPPKHFFEKQGQISSSLPSQFSHLPVFIGRLLKPGCHYCVIACVTGAIEKIENFLFFMQTRPLRMQIRSELSKSHGALMLIMQTLVLCWFVLCF